MGGGVRGGSGWGVRVDVNEELKFCENSIFFIFIFFYFFFWGGGVGLGVRVDVNEELKFL